MEIIAIKTNDGYLISDNVENKSHFYSNLPNLYFDKEKCQSTFKTDWFKIKNKPKEILRQVSQPSINRRWELKPEFNSSTLKKVWLDKEVYTEDYVMTDEFQSIKGLYEYKEDKQPDIFENISFKWEEILEIETFQEPQKLSYKAAGDWNHKSYPNVTEKNLKYDILTQILTPSILLHTQPCKLTSKETYDIIRKHIKENINPKVAEITSDYDFCFTVKKKIPLVKSYSYKVDVNNSIFKERKKKPIYETRLVDKKSIQIFEMTWKGYRNNGGYEGYTCIEPFEAENQDALKEYIDSYLEELIRVINEPLCECDKCNGTGVLSNKNIV